MRARCPSMPSVLLRWPPMSRRPMTSRINAPPSGCARAPPHQYSYPYDVFINHRGADTRHTAVARLLHDRLLQLSGGRVRPFLDSACMRPGDRLVRRIGEGIAQCKVAVPIFSRNYVASEFCLRELAALVEARKLIVPVFYGVKPSALALPPAAVESNAYAPRDVERFAAALREARFTVGLAYDPDTGFADSVS
ncbi:hypothetical protein U9M48_012060 [Paspalum notatum var. saurae]|uniref:TIR domain-containing protein n=1 Tax=Paspalum notatum var. saurae TaxID=547442 RepID=A0AAQ3SX64_PASNO